MRIIKHKSLELDLNEIMELIRGQRSVPGVAINITNDTVTVEPDTCCNLFGEYDEDYETIFYEK